MRVRGLGRPAILLFAALPSLACDALLGIHQPLDAFWDGGPLSDGGATVGDDSPPSPGFEASVEDDGGSESSVAPATWADWPMPNPPTTSLPHPQTYDTSTTPGVVLDRVTSLQWQRTLDTNPRSWSDAASYCAGLVVAGSGWRLPARIELLSIMDYTRVNPMIDPVTFPATPPNAFWTSSQSAADPTSAWVVYFGFGTSMVYSDDASKKHYVRCVR
jgi:hypothetical protein